jgi:hypothetical protein
MNSSYDPDKDPREWFQRAHSFYKGAKRLSYPLYDAPATEKCPDLFEAYSVLIALAVEAFIKCLYVIQLDKRPSGHNLLQLYNSLPKEDKTEIKKNYDAIAAKSDRLGAMRFYHPDIPLDLNSVLERHLCITDIPQRANLELTGCRNWPKLSNNTSSSFGLLPICGSKR